MSIVQVRRTRIQPATGEQPIAVRHAEAPHADALHAIFTDPEVMHWLIDVPYVPQTRRVGGRGKRAKPRALIVRARFVTQTRERARSHGTERPMGQPGVGREPQGA
jgi:hypothetical protein